MSKTNQHHEYLQQELFLSIKENDSKKLRKLIESGADVNIKNNYKNTPLHIACSKNLVEICEILIESRASLNCINGNGDTPLDIATHWNHYHIKFLLIENGGISNKRRDEDLNNNIKNDLDLNYLFSTIFWLVLLPLMILGALIWIIYSGGWLAIIAILLVILILK